MKLSAVILFGTLAIPAAASAQSSAATGASAAPCSGAEYRQLDFWVGEWIATWDNADGTKGTGKNRITRDEVGNCVITEHFSADDGSLKGFSISMFVKPANEWRQTWMDNQGGYFDLFGGPTLEPSARFGLEMYRRRPQSPYLRMIWQDVKADSFTWRWQGRAKAEDPWTDRWVIRYSRAPKS